MPCMDLTDRLLGHDAWTTSILIERARELTDAQLDHDMGIGPGSVRALLAHIVWNTEAWSASMDDDAPERLPEPPSLDAIAQLHASATRRLARVASAVRDRRAWDDHWIDRLDREPGEKTFGGAIAHVLTHSMHHRAQLLHMYRRLGLTELPEGDVLTWERTARV